MAPVECPIFRDQNQHFLPSSIILRGEASLGVLHHDVGGGERLQQQRRNRDLLQYPITGQRKPQTKVLVSQAARLQMVKTLELFNFKSHAPKKFLNSKNSRTTVYSKESGYGGDNGQSLSAWWWLWNMQVVGQAARGGAIFVEHRLVRRREGGGRPPNR